MISADDDDDDDDDGDDGDDGVNLRGALTATLHMLLKNEFSEALTWFFAG